jgi:hypothetical protein
MNLTRCIWPHPADQTCPGCYRAPGDYESCVACLHSVEDADHADGCTVCACPLHLQPGDLSQLPGARPLSAALEQALTAARKALPAAPDPEPFRIEDTCCGKCPGATCYVDQVTGA